MKNISAKTNGEVSCPPRKHSVLVVDNFPVVREGVVERLNCEADFTVCGQATNAAEAHQMLGRLQPDLMVLELTLPDKHGLEFIKDVRVHSAKLRMLVFTREEETIYALRALRAGANGFVMKREPMERFLQALHHVVAGHYAVNTQIWAKFLNQPPQDATGYETTTFTRLTDRELEVFELIGKGAGTREIAAYLNRSVSVVETCRLNIKQKLQLQDCAELVCRAVRWVERRNGLLDSNDVAVCE